MIEWRRTATIGSLATTGWIELPAAKFLWPVQGDADVVAIPHRVPWTGQSRRATRITRPEPGTGNGVRVRPQFPTRTHGLPRLGSVMYCWCTSLLVVCAAARKRTSAQW